MEASQIGRWLIVVGAVILVAGVVIWGLARLNLPLGRLPGDLTFGGENFKVSIPLGTSILLSIVLTVVLNIIVRLWRR